MYRCSGLQAMHKSTPTHTHTRTLYTRTHENATWLCDWKDFDSHLCFVFVVVISLYLISVHTSVHLFTCKPHQIFRLFSSFVAHYTVLWKVIFIFIFIFKLTSISRFYVCDSTKSKERCAHIKHNSHNDAPFVQEYQEVCHEEAEKSAAAAVTKCCDTMHSKVTHFT